MRTFWGISGAVLCAVVSLRVHASADPNDYLDRLPILVQKRLDEMAIARAPKLTPPTPLAVTWKAARIGSIDVGAALVAFTAADLDADGKSELWAVTAREVVGMSLRTGKPVEIGRVAFSGDRLVPAPRDVVGSAVVEGNELVAASSQWAKDLRVTLAKGKLASTAGVGGGFLVCPGERMQLVAGRNYFTGEFHGVRCRDDLIDRTGLPMQVRAQLNVEGKLVVDVRKCIPGAPCSLAAFEYKHAGTAFEIADVNRDGTAEAIISGFVAPGDPDSVKVMAVGSDDKKSMFTKKFNGGVVGIAVMANGANVAPTVVVAVRLAGATRVDLWRLN